MTTPVPVMAAVLNCVPWVMASERMKTKAPLTVMALSAERLPVAPLFPSWSVPALMVVAPV